MSATSPVTTRRKPDARALAILLVGLAIGAAVTASFLGLSGPRAVGPGSPLVGRQAPELQLRTLDGRFVTLSGLRGRPVWMVFWATSCQMCRAQIGQAAGVSREAERRGVEIVLVDLGESPREVRAYLSAGRPRALVTLDPLGAASARYGLYMLPTHVFVDSHGTVQRVVVGALARPDLERALREVSR